MSDSGVMRCHGREPASALLQAHESRTETGGRRAVVIPPWEPGDHTSDSDSVTGEV